MLGEISLSVNFFKELEEWLRRKKTTKKAESIEPRLLKKSQPVS
jgi:hypothetical protein